MKSDLNKLERLARPNLKPLSPARSSQSLPQSYFVHAEDPRGSNSGGGGGGGGIASPLLEIERTYHQEAEVYTSPDGLFQFAVKRIASLKFLDAEQTEAVFHLNLVQQ